MSKRKGDPGYAAGWCIHFRDASRNTSCEAGVEYDAFRGTKFDRRPCFLDDAGQSKADALPCEHLRRPTAEEIAAHEAWLEGRLNKMRTVMVGIADWRKRNKGRSFGEVVECPACKGRLHLSIAASNGHVHGHCETEGCVSWME
jgi:hypothetical protein